MYKPNTCLFGTQKLDLQLPMESVPITTDALWPITTDVVSLNPDQYEVYNIIW